MRNPVIPPAGHTDRGGHGGDFYYILKDMPGTKRNPPFRLPARKMRRQLPGLPSASRLSPQILPNLNKTLLKAILMINEIVIRVVRNNWYYGGKSIAEQI